MKKFFAVIIFILIFFGVKAAQASGPNFQITAVDLNKSVYDLPEFDSLAFILDADKDPGLSFAVNGDWRKVDFEMAVKDESINEQIFSDLHFTSGNKVELKFENKSYVKSLKIFSQTSDFVKGGLLSAATTMSEELVPDPSFKIIPRNQWLSESSNVDWPVNYYGIDHLILHHTGSAPKDLNGDEFINSADYKLMVSSIYNWQANGLGWGDIGYNYLIAPDGEIFEGRQGGEGAIGGHTLRSSVCDSSVFSGDGDVIGFNHGTIGIAVLGDYNEQSLSAAARASLINLIAKLGLDMSLPPGGYSTREGLFLPTVVGHKDVDCTSCPGMNIESSLPIIRTQAQIKYNELKNKRVYKATLLDQSDDQITLKNGQTKQVWFEFRNEGNTTWHNFSTIEQDLVRLTESAEGEKLAKLNQFSAAALSEETADEKDNDVYSSIRTDYIVSDKPNVKPGDTSRFYATITAPLGEKEEKNLVLVKGQEGYFAAGRASVTVYNADSYYSAELVDKKFSPAYFSDTTPQIVLKYKNTSTKNWTFPEIRLKVTDRANGNDAFYHDQWTNKNGFIAFLNGSWDASGDGEDDVIEPGEIATWSFDLQTRGPGLFRPQFELVRLTGEPIDGDYEAVSESILGGEVDLLTRIDTPYAAELIESTFPESLAASSRTKVKLTFKNTGLNSWNQNLVLRSYKNTQNNSWLTSHFYDYSWNSKYAVNKISKAVAPGETYSFEFYIDAPDQKGSYPQIYQLEWGSKYEEIFINNAKQWTFETIVN
ncbi:MAG TPA: peptidoglycan recognition family protein [Candidatus Bipolaricaulota bacterium]|nr:peptidoglycan recognition family protein [Candidatus Bipolaricaulota bacterium]